MMSTNMKTVKGNILDIFREAEEAYLLHGVSCQPVLHAGLAKQIITEYPSLLNFHRQTVDNYKKCNRDLLGRCTFWHPHLLKNSAIVNLYQQLNVGRDKQQLDYIAFENALLDFTERKQEGISIYIPKNIGCGNAGGDWSIVLKIIEKVIPEAILVEYNSANLQQT